MKDFNTFKENLLKKAVDVVDKTKEIAKVASDKTKTLARITRLTAEIAGDKDVIKQNYSELGKLYYEKYKDVVNDEFPQLVEEIKAAEERIAVKQAEIDALKTEAEDIEVEIEVEAEENTDAGDVQLEAAAEEAAQAVEEVVENSEAETKVEVEVETTVEEAPEEK